MALEQEFAFQSTVGHATTASSKGSAKPILLGGAALAALLGAATAGTGGVATPDLVNTPAFTGSLISISTGRITRDEQEEFLTTKEKIAAIRHYLSLNMTELATVLNVGRPTVYAWATAPAALKSKHRERIDAIYELARYWRSYSSIPMGNLVRESLPGGKTMVDLLSADELSAETAQKGMLQIKEKQEQIDKPLSVAQIAARAGIKLASRPRGNWKSASELESLQD